MRALAIGAMALALAGCESVDVAQYSADTAMITVLGNAFTKGSQVQKTAMRQAAQKTLAGGFDCFVVTGTQDEGRTGSYTVPGSAYTTTTANAYGTGNVAYGTAQSYTTYNPAQTYNFYKPGIGMQIQMFHSPPANGRCFKADEVMVFTDAKRN